ncbi:MAG: hypothetical protein NC429_04360 [Lachnospiraceae bacterium]|nr:hypothetical protein [Lachnospiraceae bacterium]
MSDLFKLPGSSYDGLIKIIRAYGASKEGVPISLAELAQISGMDRTVISRNNGFLTEMKLISEGSKKAATEICFKLGKAYALGMDEQIKIIWNEIVKNDEFLSRMISTVQIKGEMTKQDFINHIAYSSSNTNTNNTRTGASAIVEILKLTQLIEEKEGKIIAGNGNVSCKGTEERKDVETPLNGDEIIIKKNGSLNRDVISPEIGYYIQSYTCESGKMAKFIIPEDATEDDLLAFEDMLNIVLRRKFKIRSKI